jgi:hypothetical protein
MAGWIALRFLGDPAAALEKVVFAKTPKKPAALSITSDDAGEQQRA